MKKVIIVVIGSLLFIAGHQYVRRQAKYTAAQNAVAKPIDNKLPEAVRSKTTPVFAFRSEKSLLNSN